LAAGAYDVDSYEDLAFGDRTDLEVSNGSMQGLQSGATVGGFSGSSTDSIAFVLAGDVTGDGLVDLIIGNQGSTNTGLGVLVNSVAGFSGSPVFLSTGGTVKAAALGRFGATATDPLEVAAVNSNGDSAVYRWSVANSALQFAEPGPSFSSSVSAIAAADFDGDGDDDLAVGVGGGTQKFSYALYDGGFAASSILGKSTGQGGYPDVIAVGDLNNDGNADLIAATSASVNSVYKFAGSVTGSFGTSQAIGQATFTDVNALAVRDLDGDQVGDVLVGHQNGVDVYLSRTAAYTQLPGTLLYVNSIAVGDFDGDGILDVAAGSLSGPNIKVWKGSCQ